LASAFHGVIGEGTVCMIVIRSDPHKRSYTFSAVGAATGELRSSETARATAAGHERLLAWGRGMDTERVWAIEHGRRSGAKQDRPVGVPRVAVRRCLGGCGALINAGSYCSRCRPRNGSTRQWRNIRARVLYRDNWTCQQCGQSASHVDHRQPVLFGGSDDGSNLQALRGVQPRQGPA
jgi:hypothetical protein